MTTSRAFAEAKKSEKETLQKAEEYELNRIIELNKKNKELEKQNDQLKKDLQAKLLKQKQTVVLASAPTGGNCEIYRPLIAKYDWPVNAAMTVMRMESGCNPTRVSSTQDHGLFQLHLEPIYNPEANIARAYQKYVNARRGYRNWSAWYAVCTPNLVPIYEGITCSS